MFPISHHHCHHNCLLVKALTFRRYLLTGHVPDSAFLSLVYLRRPHSSLVPPHSVYRRPEAAPRCASPCLNFIPLLQLGLPSLAAASLLTLPLSQSSPPLSLSCLLLSRIRLLRHADCLGPCFIVRRLRVGFLQGFPDSQRGQGKRVVQDPLLYRKKCQTVIFHDRYSSRLSTEHSLVF